ncbi:MAG: hypothetical protein K6W08_16350 [Firmicutes bacterium]|nr:hypothetical protein [Bacillota bacterium]
MSSKKRPPLEQTGLGRQLSGVEGWFPPRAAGLAEPSGGAAAARAPVADTRPNERTNVRPNERSDGSSDERPAARTDERTAVREEAAPAELLDERTAGRTNERPRVRHSFDVYRDQIDALQEIQLLRKRRTGRRPTLGELVQQALDRFIEEEYSRLKGSAAG